MTRTSYAGFHVFRHGGSFEIFHMDATDTMGAGWYWWPCWPGCLPDVADDDGAIGPFKTAREAYLDARDDT